MKRLLDICGSLIAITVLSPLFVLIAILVKASSRGPILYRGVRVGLNGQDFYLWKFRSMVPNAERLGGSATANDDPRITGPGRALRKLKLDELPQFFNVLRGDMSLVGPRPEVRKYVNMYTPEQKPILTVKPGITDWATIWNSDEGTVLAGSIDPEADYERVIRPAKLAMQLKYVRTHDTLTDVRILSYTLIKLFNKNWSPRELSEYAPVGTSNGGGGTQ
jgi:lipopolysaccharide/colanic/teichoic acid biosynthesis glycosyltransferase